MSTARFGRLDINGRFVEGRKSFHAVQLIYAHTYWASGTHVDMAYEGMVLLISPAFEIEVPEIGARP